MAGWMAGKADRGVALEEGGSASESGRAPWALYVVDRGCVEGGRAASP